MLCGGRVRTGKVDVFQTSELINLALIVVLGPLLWITVRGVPVPQRRVFMAGLGAMVAGFVATVLESVVAPELLNLVEHACFAVAALLFAIGLFRVGRLESRGR
jgi:hypothetical protein